MQALRVQPCPGVAPELAWKYEGPLEKVGVPATLSACRHQQQHIRVCSKLNDLRPSSASHPEGQQNTGKHHTSQLPAAAGTVGLRTRPTRMQR